MTDEEQLNEVANWVHELRAVMAYGISKGREGWRDDSALSLIARLHERIARVLRDPTPRHAASAAAYVFMAADKLEIESACVDEKKEDAASDEDAHTKDGAEPSYTYGDRTFSIAALVIAGINDTYAVLDTVGMDGWLEVESMADLLPDGTYDGETTHPAAIVTFQPELAYGSNYETGEPDEWSIRPNNFIPVPLEEAWRALMAVPVWSKAAAKPAASRYLIDPASWNRVDVVRLPPSADERISGYVKNEAPPTATETVAVSRKAALIGLMELRGVCDEFREADQPVDPELYNAIAEFERILGVRTTSPDDTGH